MILSLSYPHGWWPHWIPFTSFKSLETRPMSWFSQGSAQHRDDDFSKASFSNPFFFVWVGGRNCPPSFDLKVSLCDFWIITIRWWSWGPGFPDPPKACFFSIVMGTHKIIPFLWHWSVPRITSRKLLWRIINALYYFLWAHKREDEP